MKYYYVKNGQQAGPVDESQLTAMGVTSSTLVWCQGMKDWTKAGEVSALAYLFGVPKVPVAPPLHPVPSNVESDDEYVEPPTDWLTRAILVTIFCFAPFGILGIVWASTAKARFNNGYYEGAEAAAALAGKWTKIGFFIGMGIWALIITYYTILACAAMAYY